MIKGLEAFSHGQLQDALTVLKVLQRKSITEEELREHVIELVTRPPRATRHGFMKRTTREQRLNVRSGRRRK